ncbi:hypothetical protein Esi_0153_0033 [Ectocarpus siliculosus]|uniref:Uncharacterized protein n=1 Tax=Ectocarpus siliculosus TaxID=2880 RepID=D7FL36_ECTSI|nr:hypothetical protein Esi_0153_0033 [Ectocarpus siliculosus]|eukprot:CBJ29573.1 hypothetical protein Esi_0153_0033 [Ectocarpus siliculosus]
MTQQSKERKIKAEPIVEWRTLFPLAAKALGAATVAAGLIAASVSGFNVGMSICAEICKAFIEWTSTSSEFKASGEVADKMNEALQDTLALEDERIARMRKELVKRSTTQKHKDTMMEDMLGEVLDRQAKVMEAYTHEKILYQLQSLSSRLTSIAVGANGAPTPSTAAGSMGDEDAKDEESDEKEEDESQYEDGDEENSAYSLECSGG